jgi:GAF domain-containing protein
MTFQELQPKVTEITLNTTLSETKTTLYLWATKQLYWLLQLGWFYFANHDTKTLHLGPYGCWNRSYRYPFWVRTSQFLMKTLVPDVAAQDNYIACSFTVKSEIVVPLFVDGKILVNRTLTATS